MKQRYPMIALVFGLWLAATSCSKSADTSEAAVAREASAATASRATPSHSVEGAPSSPPADTTSPTSGTANSRAGAAHPPLDAETLRKKAQIEWALKQDGIKNDSNGQWAVRATASSAYNDAQGNSPYSPAQATGVPNIEGYGHSASAWAPKTPDAGIEWLELEYPEPVHATAVRVRESYGAGAVMKIELIDEKGTPHTMWSGADPTKSLDYLVAEFPKTAFKTARVKVTLATNVVGGANQIDAVQLVGTDK